MKECPACLKNKAKSDFRKASRTKDGLDTKCRVCRNQLERAYRNRDGYREKRREQQSVLYHQNIEINREKSKAYAARYKDKKAAYDATYREKNREKIAKRVKEWTRLKYQNDPIHRIKSNLRSRIYKTVAHGCKSAKSIELLGCTAEEFKNYLSTMFKPGMSWDNYGPEWHVDHVVPCCSFDLSKAEGQRKCFHYSNCQPLWAEENLRKGRTYTPTKDD